jgi:hypothetical protein
MERRAFFQQIRKKPGDALKRFPLLKFFLLPAHFSEVSSGTINLLRSLFPKLDT